MAGIAAFFGKDRTALSDLSDGLSPRGHDTEVWRKGELGLAIRAALPVIHTGDGLAAVVEGVTQTSRMLADYATHGAVALVRAGEPYAIAVADPEREALALARGGDGPALYYALVGSLQKPDPASGGDGFRAWSLASGWSVLAAAEPGALLAAGIPTDPDPEVVRQFVESGRCDDSEATFFAGIRRLLPGQVVEVTRAGVRVSTVGAGAARPASSLPLMVGEAVRHGRLGVRLADTVDSAEVLGAVLSHRSVSRPVPAYQPVFVDPEAEPADPPDYPVTGADAPDAVRRVPVLLSAARLVADLPAFLTDVGEPVPDLAGYELWACARAGTGDLDTLLDPGTSRGGGHLSRVADRVAARYGVCVRFPIATGRPPGRERPLLAEVLDQMKDHVYGAFLSEDFASRPWVRADVVLGRFDAFLAGRGTPDPGWFWRLYLVEQWLRVIGGGAQRDAAAPPRGTFAAHPGKQLDITVEGRRWLRFPVRTNRFAPGDQVGRKVAGYVAELVAGAREEPAYRDVFSHPWYVVVAEKPVAVAQGRAHLLWRIRPGRWARGLARLASRRPYGTDSASAWILELAIREVGRWRVLFGVLASLVGRLFRRTGWYDSVVGPSVAEIGAPQTRAVYPANLAAMLGAVDPAQVAAEIATALRSALPGDVARCLAGCVVVDARDDGCQVRGLWGDRTAGFYEAVFADNPLGQGIEQTPVAAIVAGSAVRRPKRGKARTGKRQPARSR